MIKTKKVADKLSDYSNEKSMGFKFRAKRAEPLLEMIEDCFKMKGHVSIVDVGGTVEYWNIIPEEFLIKNNVKITIVNLPSVSTPQDFGFFEFVSGDACNLSCFANNSFHIAHSNSVVEHVGNWGCMLKYAEEICRIAPRYFVQTPNYWFPVEPHCMTPFFHWLPRPVRMWMVMNFQLGNWGKSKSVSQAISAVERINLLNKKMFCVLFKDSIIVSEKFLFLTKSYIAIKK